MATETIKIVYEVDDTALKSSTDVLVKQGKVIEEDANAFKALGAAANEADAGVKKLADDLQRTGKGAAPLKNTTTGFRTLREQIRDTQREVEKLTQQFGKNSVQTVQAKEKLALLRKEFKELNVEVNTLNPEGKVAAFNNLGTSIQGVFQVATGSLQAFGVESESIQKVATQFQGVLNIVQGLGSLSQVGEAIGNVGTALGVTSKGTEVLAAGLQGTVEAAESAADGATAFGESLESAIGAAGNSATLLGTYKKAQDASTNATKAGTAAQAAFNNVLKANPAFAAAAAIGLVVGAFLLYNKLKDDDVQKTEEQLDLQKETLKSNEDLVNGIEEQITKQRILNDESLGYYSDETAALKKNARERDEFVADYINKINDLNKKQKEAGLEEIFIVNPVTLGRINKLFNLREEEIRQRSALKNAEVEINNVKKEQAKIYDALSAQLDEEKKRRADAVALLREQGEPLDVILKKQQENNEWEIKALQNLRAKNADLKISEEAQNTINTALERAKEANDKARISQLEALKESLKNGKVREQIQARINQLVRDNILLNQQLGNTELQEVTKGVEDRLAAKTREIELDKARGNAQTQIINDQIEANKIAVSEYQLILSTDTQIVKNKEKVKEIQQKINDLLNQNKKLAIDVNEAIQKEQDQALEDELKVIEIGAQNRELDIENNIKNERNKSSAILKNELDTLEAKRKAYEENGKRTTEIDIAIARKKKEILDNELTDEEERQEKARELFEETAAFIFQLQTQRFEREQSDLESQKEKGLITEEQYQEKLKKLKLKQARADKEAAIFMATIKFSEALINALTITPSTAAPAALAFTAAIAGVQLASIIATPLPKFNKGTLSVAGVDMGTDTVHAMLRPGEAVIPVDTNKAYHPAIKAIYQKKISPAEINSFVLNKLSGKGSIGRDTKVTASVDTYALGRAMGKNRDVNVGNASVVGKIIANELSKKINPRQII